MRAGPEHKSEQMEDFIDGVFDKMDFVNTPFKKGMYENCRFTHCDLSNADLSYIQFIDCHFVSCNLSLVKLVETVFRDVHFRECKLSGLRWDNCNEFGLTIGFESCFITFCSFYQRKIRKTIFKGSQLKGTDFTDCDLTSAVFDGCDLADVKFEHTVLEKADLRTSYNYSIDPEMNRLKKARFSLAGVSGLLDKYDIVISE